MSLEKSGGPDFGTFEFDRALYEAPPLGREFLPSRVSNSDIIRVSEGSIGDKAAQLIQKSDLLRKIGFAVPPRTVLADGFFAGFFERNRLGDNLASVPAGDATAQKIERGSFTQEEFRVLVDICRRFGAGRPIAVRSSAAGDARVTGIYRSEFVENNLRDPLKAIKRVLASYYTTQAAAFRSEAETGEGFGIIIEPLIGNEHEFSFAPLLSGFGYTSTSAGSGYLNIVPGLGGGVQARDGERITVEQWRESGCDTLGSYLHLQTRNFFLLENPIRCSALLKTDREPASIDQDFCGLSFYHATDSDPGGVHRGALSFDRGMESVLKKIEPGELFSMMEKMEGRFHKPQYFEWAVSVEAGKPVYWITQIADVQPKLDVFDFAVPGRVLAEGHSVVGSGELEVRNIVFCDDFEDIAAVSEFNQHNTNYVLVFTSQLTSSLSDRPRLQFHHANNASVFIELQEQQHSGSPIGHLAGQFDMAGKIFAVLAERAAEGTGDLQSLKAKAESQAANSRLKVYSGAIKVLASEKQNRLLLCLPDE